MISQSNEGILMNELKLNIEMEATYNRACALRILSYMYP